MTVTDEEIEAFFAYLSARKYSRSTSLNFVCYLRKALDAGTLDPEEVDEKFRDRRCTYRGDVRQALRRFGEFRRATA